MIKLGIMWVGLLLLGLGMGVIGAGDRDRERERERVETPETEIQRKQNRLAPTETVRVITMAAVGDVMLGRSVREQILQRGDWTWPFLQTKKQLAETDVTVGNLESPIVKDCTQHENRMVFCTNPEALTGLTAAGFDVMTLANNHMLNYGAKGLSDTRELLNEVGIGATYNGELTIAEVKGLRMGFLGYDDVSRPLDLDEVKEQVASAAAVSDVTITMVHWGNEYMASPSARQREIAVAMAESGADMIIGSHPHWLQPVENLGRTLVFWSLGNFVFDQMWSEETRRGAMAKIDFKFKDDILIDKKFQMMPVTIYEYGQPRWE